MNIQQDACKIWFNPERGWYQLYDKDGKEIILTLDASITIEDNFSKAPNIISSPPLATAKIEFMVQVVNEEPKPIAK